MEDQNTDLSRQAEEQQLKILSSAANEPVNEEPSATEYEDPDTACQETSIPCQDPFQSSACLSTLQFTQSQEDAVQQVVRLSEGSRERVLERLWERAVARLIAEEARRVLGEAKSE